MIIWPPEYKEWEDNLNSHSWEIIAMDIL